MDEVYGDSIWHASQCREQENRIKLALISEIKKHGLQERVTVNLVDALPLPRKKEIVITDNVLADPHVRLWPEYYGSFWYEPVFQDSVPTRLFNCFINRACPLRQSWMYQFIRRDLLKDGNVSYRLDYRGFDLGSPKNLEDRMKIFEIMLHRGNLIFEKEHEVLRGLVPLQTFKQSLEQAIIDSRISLVIETYFDDPRVIAFSEKIFRALVLPRPFMLYGSAGSVGVLRSIGFDVYDDIVDHGYDDIVDNIQRQIRILDDLEAFRSLDFSDQLRNRLERGRIHNMDLLKSLKQRLPNRVDEIKDYLKTLATE